MSLHGKKMAVGDVVYDIIKGAGTVIADGGGLLSVSVDFGVGGVMKFAQDGTLQGMQRLFWGQPIIISAKGPNDKAYQQTMALAKVIYDHLSAYEKINQTG